MAKKPDLFHIRVPIFGMYVVVCTDCEPDIATGEIYDHSNKEVIAGFTEGSLGGVRDDGGDIYMWVKNGKKDPRTVFHELVHVSHTLCEIKGIEPDEELLAYLMGWLKVHVADRIFYPPKKKRKKKEKA